ncbi:RHS repeat-associated core domain-containing protein, partial [Bacteroides bouchesdurhonensis]|uniref:RHS repeat-associated core domain-containing protein n=1 Tax=Bacteroides bouchesdurhonensis TaxID=1841855 RepID=UPI00101AD780
CGNAVYENGVLRMLLNEAGYVSFPDRKFHFYLKDHQGNTRVVADKDGNVEETNNYYPFGGTFTSTASVQPYKYNGKELDAKNGLNWYDYGARHYDAAIGRWRVVDPMSEKYWAMSPYVYCTNNPVNRIDPDGRDWYQNNETKCYVWYDGNDEKEGYTYIGEKGLVLGEFESIINGILTDPNGFNTKSLYSEGFTFDIAPNDKGGLLASKERGWDFFDEFANGVGPEFSVLLSDHPYTEAMKTDKTVLEWQQRIADGKTDAPGQATKVKRSWSLLNVFGTITMAKQFIGSYRYDAFTSSDGKTLNNVISDSKSRTSLFFHLPFSNQSRNQTRAFSNTYQFYIWKSSK